MIPGWPRRGPGSGVRATAPHVALLLISVLATESLSQSEERARAIAEMRPRGFGDPPARPYTGEKSFVEAFAAVLADYEKVHPDRETKGEGQ